MVIMFLASKKLVAAGLALTLVVGLLAGCGSSKPADKKADKNKVFNVGIAQLVEHPALDAANKGFVDGLTKKGFKDGQNIKLDKQNAQADQSNLQNIAQRFVSNKMDLICAIATPTAQTMANATKDIPIVGTAITDYEAAKLVKSKDKPGTNVTGTTDMNPVKEQVDLMLKLVPNTKTIGLIYCSSEVNSQLQATMVKNYAKEKGLQTLETTVSTVNDIQQAAQNLVGKADAIYVPTDNVLASAMPTLIAITNEAHIPVICGEANMLKAGGFATLAVDYYKLGVTTGEMAGDILAGKAKAEDMAIKSQDKFETLINKNAVEALGLTIPADMQQYVK